MYTKFLDKLGTAKLRELDKEDDCQYVAANLDEFWDCIKEYLLQVEVIQPAGYNNLRDTSLTWNVEDYGGDELHLLIEFKNALQISSNDVLDTLKVQFITQTFFFDDNLLPIQNATILERAIPLQLQLGTE